MVKGPTFEIRYRPAALEELLGAGAYHAAWIYEEVTKNLSDRALTPSGRQRHELEEPLPELLRERIDEVCPGSPAWEQRVGGWRIIYAVCDGNTVFIVAVGLKGRQTLDETFRRR